MNIAARNTVRVLPGCVCAVAWLFVATAFGQRMQFPTPVADPYLPAYAAPPGYAAPPAYTPPAGGFTPYAQPNPYAVPPGGYPAAPYAAGVPPGYAPGPYPPAAPGAFDPYALGPSGGLPAPAATPYAAAPYSATPNSLFPDTSSFSFPEWASPNTWFAAGPTGQRFIREVRGEYTWLVRNGDEGLGVTDVELSATMQFPMFQGRQPPLLLTPGFAFHFWDGPQSTGMGSADMPPRTYDAFLDTAWNPEITSWLSAELDVRVGMYTDFDYVITQSLRVLGSGLGVVTLSPVWKAKVGVWYIDRFKVKLLPAFGFVWTPNEETRWELFFPRPKLANRLTMIGSTVVWWYVAGEYGGGAWTLRREDGSGDRVDYNDIRISLGVDWAGQAGWKGMLEVGYAFDRELYYASQQPTTFDPGGTFMLRAGLAY